MSMDSLYTIAGVDTLRGQRNVQVRIVTDSAGRQVQLHELYLIRSNGDWDYIDSVDAVQAIAWLIGDES